MKTAEIWIAYLRFHDFMWQFPGKPWGEFVISWAYVKEIP